MTQILTVLTHDFVVTVADRRLTTYPGGNVVEDDECKLVSIGGGSVIAYTGLARIGGEPTHVWIARRLAAHDCTSGAMATEILSREATARWRTLPATHRLPHWFIVNGWESVKRDGSPPQVLASMGVVTNLANDGRTLDEFGVTVHAIEPDQHGFECHGAPLTTRRSAHVLRVLSALGERRVGATEFIRFLASEVAVTSDLTATVGNRVLAVATSRAAGHAALCGRGSIEELGHNAVAASEFCYVDPADTRFRRCGPTVVWKHWALADLEIQGLRDGEDGFMQYRVLQGPPGGVHEPMPIVGLVGASRAQLTPS